MKPIGRELGEFKEGGLINGHLTDTIPPRERTHAGRITIVRPTGKH